MARRQYVAKKKNPLIVICSEGGNNTSEKKYFKNFRSRNLRIQFSTGNSTDPKGMLDDLLKYIKNEDIKSEDNCFIFLVIDTDLDSSRIDIIKSIEVKCRQNNIKIITSAPTFEIWYLMHFKDVSLKYNSSEEVKQSLNKILYGKYKESLNIYPIISSSTDLAYSTAAKINELSLNDDLYVINPHSSIYKIIDIIRELSNN